MDYNRTIQKSQLLNIYHILTNCAEDKREKVKE